MRHAFKLAKNTRHALIASLLTFPLWGACEGIRDCEHKATNDARYLCTAAAMVNPVICDQISTTDGVSQCRAITSKNSYECDRITSPGKRQYCLMAVRDLQRDSMWAIKRMN
jgi:hypothetical protein